MANRREYEMLFQLNAQLGGSYNSTFKNAQGSIASMQKEIAALNKIQSDITSYQKQQGAVEASKKKLEVLQQQYDNIQKEMNETGQYSSALENKLLAKQLQIEKTSTSIASQTDKLNRMADALRTAGVDIADLTGESAKLGTQIDAIKAKQEEAADEATTFGAKASTAFNAIGQAITAAGIAAALKEIADYYAECAAASMEFESAMTGVSKTTDMSNTELAAMGKEIKELTTEIPITTSEFAEIAEVAGQLGIAKGNLLDFSEVMAMLATATTMTAEEGATMLAQFANITQMDQTYFSNLASSVVALGNSYATTEKKITEMAQGIAASASLAGMSEADMLGLSAAVTSLGIETQAGSTSMSKLISELMTAVETGDNLEEFAQIANMSAEEFGEAWGENAVTALQAFVVGLNDTERNGKSATVVLNELGITEARMQRMVLSLANSGDLLNRTLATSSRAWAENTALTAEAEKRYATTQSQLTLMQNAYNNLKIAIGDNFTPTLRELYGVATDILRDLTAFIEANPELVRGVTAFIGVAGTATVGLTAYAAAAKIATAVTGAFTTAAGVSLLGPVMAAVGGVAALVGVIVALSDATNKEAVQLQELTAASKAQYYELEDMRAEYEDVCDVMGETSAEAQLLKRKLDEATEAFEESKQTSEEFAAANREVIDSYYELVAAYEDTIDGIEREARSNVNLMKKLEELMDIEGKSAETKQEILTIVEMLNEAMPELGLAYDQYADSLNMSADAIRAVIEAELAREKNAANYKQLKEQISQESELYAKLQNNIAEVTAREKELAAAQAAEAAKRKELGTPGMSQAGGREYAAALLPYIEATSQAQRAVEAATEAERAAQAAYDDNQKQIAALTGSLAGYSDVYEEHGGKIRDVIKDIRGEMEQLVAKYDEAYKAALDSVSGQYNLWDDAAEVVAKSAGEINKSLESQVNYWQDYNANLATLTERSSDIEGLAEMIASFADGSTDSVNAIAGMAKASDKDLASMVKNWQDLQNEQKSVADYLAQLETDFSASMDALQQELEASIADMDLSDAAAESGKNTIQGFIAGAEGMLPSLQAAYSRIAQAAVAAIDDQLDINSPSKVLKLRGEFAMAGFEEGISSKEHDVIAAMSGAASTGVDAITTGAISAILNSNGYGPGVNPVFNINYDFTGASVGDVNELRSVLGRRDDELKEFILDVIDDRQEQIARKAFH